MTTPVREPAPLFVYLPPTRPLLLPVLPAPTARVRGQIRHAR